MKQYTVVLTPEAEEQPAELYGYIADRATDTTALRYTTAVVDYCAKLKDFPHRGTQRDDIRPGLRITSFKKNTVIAFSVNQTLALVTVIGIFHGGRNIVAALQAPGTS